MATADTYPHIGLATDGKAVIEGTRYTVEHIASEQYFFGWSAEEILRQHPDLRPAEAPRRASAGHRHACRYELRRSIEACALTGRHAHAICTLVYNEIDGSEERGGLVLRAGRS